MRNPFRRTQNQPNTYQPAQGNYPKQYQNYNYNSGGQQQVNPNNPYYIPPKDSFKITTRRTKIIEGIMVLTPIVVGLVLFGLTFQVHARDSHKEKDIAQIIAALRLFYENSSDVEGNRVYPISLDSQINEVDYEYTLRLHLTGQTRLDRHAYVPEDNYPTDPWGVYTQSLVEREAPFNRLEGLPFSAEQREYLDGFPSCNFNSTERRFSRCYLYASNGSGETFRVGYYSEVREGLVIYSETRNNQDSGEFSFISL